MMEDQDSSAIDLPTRSLLSSDSTTSDDAQRFTAADDNASPTSSSSSNQSKSTLSEQSSSQQRQQQSASIEQLFVMKQENGADIEPPASSLSSRVLGQRQAFQPNEESLIFLQV
jgi:hypothetical protein